MLTLDLTNPYDQCMYIVQEAGKSLPLPHTEVGSMFHEALQNILTAIMMDIQDLKFLQTPEGKRVVQ